MIDSESIANVQLKSMIHNEREDRDQHNTIARVTKKLKSSVKEATKHANKIENGNKELKLINENNARIQNNV